MSGVTKAVRKVFKPVVKYAPIALGAAALVFTAGAALGVPGTAGGWGGAVSKLTQSLGAGDMLTNTLTGALTQAGYGAVLGAGTSLLTGGDFAKGAGFGAAGGAVTGGLMGAAGMKTDPLGGIGMEDPASETAMGVQRTDLPGPPAGLDQSAMESAAREGRPFAGYSAGYGDVVTGGGGAAALPGSATAAGGGGLLAPGGWVERNQGLVGYGVQGLGQGLMGMAASDDAGRAGELALERDERERRYIRENYGSGDVPGYRKVAETTGNPTPATRFDPASYNYRWEYDSSQGKIVKVQDQ